MFQPCLAACEDQVHKFLVTHASYPNEDSFVGTVAFCNLLQKLVILLFVAIFFLILLQKLVILLFDVIYFLTFILFPVFVISL